MKKQWFENKKISVVGNAESLLHQTHGKKIDSADVVIRINQAAPICFPNQYPKTATGERTDVWVNRSMRPANLPTLPDPQPHVVSAYAFIGQDQAHIHCCKVDYTRLKQQLAVKTLSMGLFVLYYLSECDAKSVSVLGFDFKTTPTFYDKQKRLWDHKVESANHDYIREKQLFEQQLIKQHKFKWIC